MYRITYYYYRYYSAISPAGIGIKYVKMPLYLLRRRKERGV
ncbi:hypothetical protein CLAFUW4_13865 [Fulvia fulva]|nr:uncharacterized protein CLAFUR5_20361 [Fulvia fulva]KAK4610658.1 hypothetical protein CLAFUR4_13868 [Fulvia fulva]KAK4611330.1 hypothetical protein CLAFUR0_13872 [Fulvia fulva]WMI39070.1 hypothetical protein CLAFUR5_20361 [Fulvia fulva]WPV22033.1 hypothetical protein CLAFUW4_13865 [Fulvia fulva]WPV37015.1 hypothetical protein CLAFUW7_13873 [Fulvia fulva]